MSIAKKAGKASIFLFLKKAWGGILSVFVMAYLARVLNIKDFGVIAISSTLITFIQVFVLSGISEYVIFYNENDKERVVNASFWLNLMLTIFIVIIIAIVAPFWASFYDDPRIVNIIYLLLVGFFFSMLSSIPIAIYRKKIDYRDLVFIQMFFGTSSQISQVLLAYYDFGVYSLALPSAIFTPLSSIVLIYKSKFRPKFSLEISYWKKIFNYTRYIIVTRVIGILVNNGDNLLIAKILSVQALGVYDVAFKLSNLFIKHFNPIITNISLPILAEKSENLPKLRIRFKKMINMISVVNIPIIIGMILFSEPLIINLYGEKWTAAVVPFQILSIFVLFRSIGSPASSLYNAIGKPKIGFYFTLIYLIPFFTTLYVSSFYGLIGFCIGIMIIRSLGSSTHIIISSRLLKYSLGKLVKIPIITLFCSLIAFLLVIVLRQSIHLILQIILYIFSFVTLYFFCFKRQYLQMINDFKSVIPTFQKS